MFDLFSTKSFSEQSRAKISHLLLQIVGNVYSSTFMFGKTFPVSNWTVDTLQQNTATPYKFCAELVNRAKTIKKILIFEWSKKFTVSKTLDLLISSYTIGSKRQSKTDR